MSARATHGAAARACLTPLPMRRSLLLLPLLASSMLCAGPAAADTPPATQDLEQTAQTARAYLAVWELDGKAACEAKAPACEGMDLVLDRAARAFAAAGKRTEAIAAWSALVDPRNRLSRTASALGALRKLGAAHEAVASYEDAAIHYERYARDAPSMEEASELLAHAAELRMRLGHTVQAAADVELFVRAFGAKQPAEATRLRFALARHHGDRGDWEASRALLAAAMPALDRSPLLEPRIVGHALLGRALAELGRGANAAAEYGKVVAAAKARGRAEKGTIGLLSSSGVPSAAPRDDDSWTAASLDATGEALLFFAEQKRARAEGVQLRAYQGKNDRESLLAYHRTQVADWVRRKSAAIEEAEIAYARVLGIEPPPPRPPARFSAGGDPNAPTAPWGTDDALASGDSNNVPSPRFAVVALARVGALWADFVRAFRSVPIPRQWPLDGPELRGAYFMSTLDPADEPYKQRAKRAFVRCLQLGLIHRIVDEHTRSCEAWLARNHRVEYSVRDELHPLPAWSSNGLITSPALR